MTQHPTAQHPAAQHETPAGPDLGAPVPAVAAALERLNALDGSPVSEHVEVFDGVHRLLQDALATLGIVGPTRMDYPGSMAAVRAVARYVSRILDQA